MEKEKFDRKLYMKTYNANYRKKEENLKKKRDRSREHYQENKEYYREKRLRWIEKNKEYAKKMYRKKHLMYKFKMTLEKYESMFERQKGVCKICKKPSEKKLSIDHCHDTGEVRGLLCFSCNVGIGYLKDSEELLSNAIKYLHEHKSSHARG